MNDQPWIKHDGTCCPLPIGTPIEAVMRHPVTLREYEPEDGIVQGGASWFWAGGPMIMQEKWVMQIVRYRVRNTDSEATRAARIQQFRDMAQPNEWDVKPVKAPEKETA